GKLGYRHEPRLMVAAFGLSQLAALPDALLALWLMLLGEGVLARRPGMVEGAALGLVVSAAAAWFLRTVSTRVQRRFRDKVTIALESHVAQLQASVATIAHQERPEYLDRLSMLRNQVFVLDHMYMSLFSTLGWILRLGVTMTLLASIHPALMLLVVFAVVARAGMGDFRLCLCRRGRVRVIRARCAGQPGAAGPGRRCTAVGVYRGHRGRDWLPAWILDGRLAAARVARGLRRVRRR